MLRRLTVTTLAGSLLLTAGIAAQQFVLSSQDRARLVSVDFAAVTADGTPITNLRSDEVQLRIDGRTRAIRSLEYVPIGGAPGLAGLLPFGTNAATDQGRSVVLMVDLETIRPGREAPLKEEVARFLRTLGPQDRAALLTIPYGGLKADLTTEHTRVIQALAPLSGQAPSAESDADASCRTRTTLVSLRGAIDDLRGGEAPVAVVLFSGSMASPTGVVAMQTGQPIGRCQLLREHFQHVADAVANARAQMYIVQPELQMTSAGQVGLEHLTGVTGAPLLHLTGPDGGGLARVARESAGYYIARFEPEPEETQGSVRNLGVSLSRDGAVLRSRPKMTVVRQNRFAGAAATTPLAMMKESRLFRDVPLRVAAYASREPGTSNLRVVTLFDTPGSEGTVTEAMVGLFSDDGKLVASRTLSTSDLQGAPVVTALTAPPGRYRVRVAAIESTGRGGTADFTLDASLGKAGAMAMSDLVLGLSRDGQFRPKLDFGSEASVMAQLEIYGGREGARVGAVVELATSVNGPALLALPGTFSPTADPDRFLLNAAVPIGALPPGDYVVRATVAAEGQPGGRVVRPIRKVVR
jgi:hypothetical protein